MEDAQLAAIEERKPVETVASPGFPFTRDRDSGVGLSLCSIRLLGGLVGPTDSVGTFKAFGDVGSASVAGTGASLQAAKGTAKPTAVSAVGHRYFFYSPEMSLLAESELTSSTTPVIAYEYIWFNGHPVAQVDAGISTHWTFTDHLGTPIIQTDDSGTITWLAEHEPYGKVFTLRAGDEEHQPLRLPGQEAEQFNLGANGATERSYNIFRWYRPTWGRYTQPDPIWITLGSSTNLYAYVDGRPTLAADALGLVSSAAECDKCCTPQRQQDEYEHSWLWTLIEKKRYTFGLLAVCRGESCLTSADRLRRDLEQFVKPRCWITSTQLAKGFGADVIRRVGSWLGFDVYGSVHYVVKYTPCLGGQNFQFDAYTFAYHGPLNPGDELDHP